MASIKRIDANTTVGTFAAPLKNAQNIPKREITLAQSDLGPFFQRIMTPELAGRIRELRTRHSWRAVSAILCAQLLEEDLHRLYGDEATCWRHWDSDKGNQYYGMDLCAIAAAHFGEDANAEPWN